MHRKFMWAVMLLAASNSFAQEIFAPAERKLLVHATAIKTDLDLDGKLTEEQWYAVKPIGNFVQIEPSQGKPSQFKTEVRTLYNENYLYIGIYCEEPDGVRAPDLKRDFNWRAHDTFAICIDGFSDERNSISIVTNPYGAQKDYLSFDATFFDGDWNGLWTVRTHRTDSSWTAEFQIPWKTLRYPNLQNDVQSWNVNFLRLRRLSNEISVWSPYPRSFSFNRMEYAGRIDSLVVPPPAANVQFTPYVLTTAHHKKYTSAKDENAEVKFGGEVKWTVNPNTVLDLTANTDFAQADADIQINNITRFSVLFPERRQFFLENASLFGSGLSPGEGVGGRMTILPFFSRQIGLVNGTPVPLDAGARLVHRSTKHNYGGIFMRQRESTETPQTNFFTGRFSQNIGSQNRIGSLITLKSVNETDSTARTLNSVGVVDGFFRLDNANSINGMAMFSAEKNTSHGYAGFLQYLYTTNVLQGWWTQSLVTENFNPQVGFLSRKNVIATTPGINLNLRGPWLPFQKLLRAYKPTVSIELYHQASTRKLVEREIKFIPLWFELQSGGYFGYTVSHLHQNLLTSFTPLNITITEGKYEFLRNMLSIGSDASRKISYTAQFEWGKYFNGKLSTVDLSTTVAPIPHISVKASVNHNQFFSVGENQVSSSIQLYTLEGRLALNPRIQLIGLYQKNSHVKSEAYNFRFAWEYKPLSYIYVVYNNRSYSLTADHMREQTGVFKVTYLKQF